MSEASAERITVARSELGRAASSAAQVHQRARMLAASPTIDGFHEALRDAAPSVMATARHVSLAANNLGINGPWAINGPWEINGPWASESPSALLGRLAGLLRDSLAGASAIGDELDTATPLDDLIATTKHKIEELTRAIKAIQALIDKVLAELGLDRPDECGEVPEAAGIDSPDDFFNATSDAFRAGAVSLPPREFGEEGHADPLDTLPLSEIAAESGEATRGYADPFDTPPPAEVAVQNVEVATFPPPAEVAVQNVEVATFPPPAEVAIPTVEVPYFPEPLTPLPLDQPPVSELASDLGLTPSTPRPLDQGPVSELAPAGKIDAPAGKIEEPPEYKASIPATDYSTLVGKVETPAGKIDAPAKYKASVPTTDYSTLVGKVEAPVGKVEAPVGKVEAPVGKVSGPAGKIETPVPAAKRRNFLPVGLVVIGLVVGLLILGAAVLNGGLLVNQLANPSTFGAAATASPTSVAAVASGSPTVAPETPAFTTQPTIASPTEPIPTLKPTPTPAPAQPTATARPTAAPTPKPTQAPTPKPTPTPVKPTPTPLPVVSFKVTPQQTNASCKDGLAAFELSLNNSASTVSVSWSIKFNSSSYPGAWGSATPQSGTVAAGGTSSVTITPANLCSSLTGVEDFVLEIGYGGDSPETVIYNVSP